jgi:predicted small secreted protein
MSTISVQTVNAGTLINTVNIVATTANIATANIATMNTISSTVATMNVNSATVAQMNVIGTLLQLGGSNYPIIMGSNTATTSGTSKDFTGIPSWVKRITVMFSGVSTNSTSLVLIQIGTGGAPTTSGYVGRVATTAHTAGFGTPGNVAGSSRSGIVTITNLSGIVWVASIALDDGPTNAVVGGGTVTLAGVLDMVRLTTTNGTDTFDAGFINIMYE